MHKGPDGIECNCVCMNRTPPNRYCPCVPANQEEVVRYPMEIDPTTFIPQIGDKIESTLASGTVIVGTVSRVSSNCKVAYDSRGLCIYHSQSENTFRLLVRTPAKIKVGDTISNDRLRELPCGSIIERNGYTVVIVQTGDGSRRYRRVDNSFQWPLFKDGATNLVKFINE